MFDVDTLTEAAIDQALKDGLIEETHHFECKRALDTGKEANKELSRDVASLAVAGGQLVIGSAEDKPTRTFSSHPVSLQGLPERVEQVVRSLVKPHLTTRIAAISSDTSRAAVYVIVTVPPSPDAPHMVDGAQGRWSPDVPGLVADVARRAHGWALHSPYIGADREIRGEGTNRANDLLDLEIDEDGTIHMFCGRATDQLNNRRVVLPELITGLSARVLRTAVTVAATTGYAGPWVIGVSINNLHLAVAYEEQILIGYGQAAPPAYSGDTYRRVREMTLEASVDAEQDVLDGLLGPLWRALGRRSPTLSDLFRSPTT